MDESPSNFHKTKNNRLTLNYRRHIKLKQCLSENNTNKNDDLDADKETCNLFKDIVKINKVSLKNVNKSPLIKKASLISNNNYKDIFDFTNELYNNEEHLNKNQILNLKNSIKNSLRDSLISPVETFNYNLSINEKCEKFLSSTALQNFSKEKNSNIVARKSLFHSNFNFNRKLHKNITNKKYEELNNNSINKLTKKYSFFFKLKEKDKIPSKTPYLDRKYSFSSLKFNKSGTNNNTKNQILNKNNISNSPPLIKSKFINNKIVKEEKQIIKIEIDKKASFEKSKNNNININTDKKREKKEKINLDNKNEENKGISSNKKGKKNANISIINVLNKSLFCCFKS